MEPSKWRCDVCGKPVDLDNGYVVWGVHEAPTFEYRIIHQKVCDEDKKRFQSSLPVKDLVGPDGLVKLTSWLSYGPAAAAEGQFSREEVAREGGSPLPPLDAWVDLVRRLHVPNYEQTRLLYDDPEVLRELEGRTESSPYLQSTMKWIRKDHSRSDDFE